MNKEKLGLISDNDIGVLDAKFIQLEDTEEVTSAAGAAAGAPFGAAAGAAAGAS